MLGSIGKYRIIRTIGSGGMGTVFLAEDTVTRRQVALKVLPKDKAKNPTLVRRFKAEAQSAAHLRHENIVSVYEAGEADGWLYIALEYVDGIDLFDFLRRRGTVPVKRSIDIVKQVARALEHAAENNIVHRDIKPSNLLIRRNGSIKLTDFGLARSVDETMESGITRAGTTVGTIDYMAPEQARSSKAADIRSDLYSLGCTWFHMLTGKAPYPDGSLTNKLQAHAISPIPNPRDLNPRVPEGLVAVLQRLMAKRPEDRYQTPAELLADLEHAHLQSDSVSSQILEAVQEDEESFDAAAAAGRDVTREEAAQERPEVKPQRHFSRLPKESATDDEGTPLIEWIKLAVLAIVVIGFLWGIATLATRIGSAFNSPTGTIAAEGLDEQERIERGVSEEGGPAEPETIAKNSSTSKTSHETSPEMDADPSDGDDGTPVIDDQPPVDIASPGSELFATPSNPLLTPGWISQWSPVVSEAALKVDAGDHDPALAPSLMTALQRASSSPTSVELAGAQPFALSTFASTSLPGLRLYGSGGQPAVVLARPRALNDENALLSLADGSLSLENVHLVVDLSHVRSAGPITLFAVANGDVELRNCTVQVFGSDRPVRLLRVSGTSRDINRRPRGAVRVLLDRTLVQGPNVSAVVLAAPRADVVFSDSLLLTGTGHAFIGGEAPSSEPDEGQHADRYIRFIESTIVGEGSALSFAGESGSSPPRTVIGTVRSVIARTGAGDAAMAELPSWPVELMRNGSTSRYRDLEWKSADTAFVGWKKLVANPHDDYEVVDLASWQRAWKDPAAGTVFHAERWPATPPEDWTTAAAASFAAHQLATGVLEQLREQEIGAVSVVRRSPVSWIEAHLAGARALPPRPAESRSQWTQRRVDLNAQDLGEFIANLDSTDGVQIQAVGNGICKTGPVRLTSGHVRIQFATKPGNGAPLRLEPRRGTNDRERWAMFQVIGGTLEMDSAFVDLPPSSSRDLPEWFLDVRNGNFRLGNCFIRGPVVALEGHAGLIRSAPVSPGGEQTEGRIGEIEECFLLGSGDLVHLAGGNHRLFVTDSLLVSRHDILHAEAAVTNNQIICRQVSFANTGSVFELSAGSNEADGATEFFVEACAFLGVWSRSPADGPPHVLRCPASLLEPRRVTWWGVSNGYAADYETLLDVDGAKTNDPGWVQWLRTWPDGRELRPLRGRGVVELGRQPTRTRSEVSPSHFSLAGTCRGAVWNGAGEPIGVPLKGREATRSETDSPSPTTPTRDAPSGRRVIGF